MKRHLLRGILAASLCLAAPTLAGGGGVEDSLDALAQRLTRGGAAAATLAPGARIVCFDGKTLDPAALDSRFHGGTVVARLGYDGVPRSLATDLAKAMSESQLPESVQRSFVPRDAASAKRADEIAAAWVTHALSVQPGQRTGVIVVWQPPLPAEAGRPAIDAQLLFVLVRAEQDAASGAWHITRGLLGDTEQACAY
jgi:hypothetical protein